MTTIKFHNAKFREFAQKLNDYEVADFVNTARHSARYICPTIDVAPNGQMYGAAHMRRVVTLGSPRFEDKRA